MVPRRLPLIAAALWLAGATAPVLAQTGTTDPGAKPGSAPGMSQPAPSVDTGGGANRNPAGPNATGSVGGNPPGTIPPGPKSAIGADISGRNPCYPGQSSAPAGSSNPAGAPSRC